MALFEFQDHEGTTWCCEGENPPDSVEEGNATGWSGCDKIDKGACVGNPPASVGDPNLQVRLDFDNKSSATDEVFVVGDPIGLLSGLMKGLFPGVLLEPTKGSIRPDVFKKYVGDKPYRIRKMRIIVSDKVLFESSMLNVGSGNIAGGFKVTPLQTRIDAINPQFNGNGTDITLPLKPSLSLSTTTALFVAVPAGQSVSITFS